MSLGGRGIVDGDIPIKELSFTPDSTTKFHSIRATCIPYSEINQEEFPYHLLLSVIFHSDDSRTTMTTIENKNTNNKDPRSKQDVKRGRVRDDKPAKSGRYDLYLWSPSFGLIEQITVETLSKFLINTIKQSNAFKNGTFTGVQDKEELEIEESVPGIDIVLVHEASVSKDTFRTNDACPPITIDNNEYIIHLGSKFLDNLFPMVSYMRLLETSNPVVVF